MPTSTRTFPARESNFTFASPNRPDFYQRLTNRVEAISHGVGQGKRRGGGDIPVFVLQFVRIIPHNSRRNFGGGFAPWQLRASVLNSLVRDEEGLVKHLCDWWRAAACVRAAGAGAFPRRGCCCN